MNRLMLIVALLSVVCSAQTTQSPPTSDQHYDAVAARGKAQTRTQDRCDTDLAAWKAEAENDSLNHRSLSVEKLNDRSKELLFCEIDYPHAPEKSTWEQQRYSYSDTMALRYQAFLERHQLWNAFLEEDESGKR